MSEASKAKRRLGAAIERKREWIRAERREMRRAHLPPHEAIVAHMKRRYDQMK